MKPLKIAIYSGIIPSTTFIENLIRSVASEHYTIYLFGANKKRIRYADPNIRIFASPNKKWSVVLFVWYYRLQLYFTSAFRYRLLRNYISNQKSSLPLKYLLWAKYLPVVTHLPDVFHIQWAKGASEWIFLKELFNTRLIVSLRGAHINYMPLADHSLAEQYKTYFKQIDGFHAVCKDIAKNAEPYGATANLTRVIYSGIDLTVLRKYEKVQHAIQNQNVNLISVGRIHWKKGYHFALDVLKVLMNQGYSFHYTLVAGLNEEEILYQVHDLGLSSHITIIKFLPQEKVFSLMQQSDLMLLPSFEEGVANVALEAMAIGLPVLSSDCGGMPEVIHHLETGYLYEKRNAGDLLEKLKLFITQPVHQKQQLASAAKEFVHQHHSLHQLGTNMRQFYTDVTRDHS